MRSRSKRENGASEPALTSLVVSRYWRADEATRVVEAWQRSGMSGAAFARQHGFQVRRLLRWRERLQERSTPVFHPVRIVEDAEAVRARPATLALELRGGRRIHVHGPFDAQLLEELVRVVEGFRC